MMINEKRSVFNSYITLRTESVFRYGAFEKMQISVGL